MKGAGKKEPPAMAAASPRRARSPVRGPCPSRCGRTGAAGSRASPARLRARATPPGRRRLTTSTGSTRAWKGEYTPVPTLSWCQAGAALHWVGRGGLVSLLVCAALAVHSGSLQTRQRSAQIRVATHRHSGWSSLSRTS